MGIRTLTVFGTRPEAIKMAPLINQLKQRNIENKICLTGQHQHMLAPILELFNITPDFNLDVMSANQGLANLTSKILLGLEQVFKEFKPDIVLVHGDTTTTFAASLSAYYHRVRIAHIEAGLRTGNIYSPWPEEANRKLTAALTEIHFTPTELSRENLIAEGISLQKIFVTGNTVIDALLEMTQRIDSSTRLHNEFTKSFSFLSHERKFILVTGHRRENFGRGLEQICHALKQIAESFPDIDIVYPVHLNPNVLQPVKSMLGSIPNIYLIEPVNYLPFVWLMKESYFILTDSGGIQEEAPSLGKPVLVMREATERLEAVIAGTVKLVGASTTNILEGVVKLLKSEETYLTMSKAKNPYGDGLASARIAEIISKMEFDQLTSETLHAIKTKINNKEELFI
ncbi:UDP-N-acetylglucosamine 2-epimerase [Legionella jamestowniensis]|uniref:UDP-N-acetylglucosamine 2-epimerase (non-hydrolyzing) n=1 Tax=Legionella jamestowniensis TaxID=455 RepID=A0ABX2XSY3_9GAMM|nr:UDP-N-acetylglucosamine 2-epimerase (non-hydrolyzing) [Legionella jamestowniensis]OCH97572.1 UDP-N-acetylglucosamine 2-epimerase [Legionella jamestowniensis]